MNGINIKFLLSALLCVASAKVSAYDAEINGIYYNFSGSEATVTYKSKYMFPYTGEVVIPETVNYKGSTYKVTSIGDKAFAGCSVTSVTIPNSVCFIGEMAFRECSALTTLTIPNGVTSIGKETFRGCSSLTSVTIPNSVTSIGYEAFDYCSSLTSVTIPNSVTTIGYCAFYNCTRLTSVTIPNSVTSIEDLAFSGCSSLTAVHITDLAAWCKIEFFSTSLFYQHLYLNNQEITELRIPDGVTSIGNNAFCGCKGLTSISIPNSVTSIGNEAFGYCSGLTSVTIPNSVTSIGNRAFYNCVSLTSVTIPNSVTSIGYEAFAYCNSFTSFTIPNSVTSIGYRVFYGCEGLTSVTISNSVTSIGEKAFYGCRLGSVTIGSGVLSIDSNAFDYHPAKVIWLTNTPPSGYRNAEGYVNYVANDLYTSLDNVKVYPFISSMFEVDGVKYVPVSPSERTCDAIDCVYDESTEHIYVGETVTNKGISFAVKQINPYTFYGNKFIKDVNYDLSGEIGNNVFADCSAMHTATLGNSVTSIGASAFSGCSSLPTIQIPQSVNSIGGYSFEKCSELKTVIIADSESELQIGSNGSKPLFADCPLESVYIGRNISYSTGGWYGYSPFYRNTSLRSVTITDKETEISENEFYGCTNLKDVRIGNGVTTIGDWAFSGCSSLDFFSFGSSVESIGKEAFSDCTAITKLISQASTPPTCDTQALDDINKWDCTLFVPSGDMSAYQQADQWKEFFFITDDDSIIKISGDVNGDGSVTKADVEAVANHIMSKPVFGTFDVDAADVNGDGKVNAADLVLIIKMAKK